MSHLDFRISTSKTSLSIIEMTQILCRYTYVSFVLLETYRASIAACCDSWNNFYTAHIAEISTLSQSIAYTSMYVSQTHSTSGRGGAEIARPDIARPDNPAPCPLRWFRLPSVLYALMSRKTTELYVKVFQRVQQLVPQFAPTCAMAEFEEASVAEFFLDCVILLCQITVQTFSIIIATLPSANAYLCCWRCLLVNNMWLYDCALTGALSCFIERRRTVNGIQDDAMMTTKT